MYKAIYRRYINILIRFYIPAFYLAPSRHFTSILFSWMSWLRWLPWIGRSILAFVFPGLVPPICAAADAAATRRSMFQVRPAPDEIDFSFIFRWYHDEKSRWTTFPKIREDDLLLNDDDADTALLIEATRLAGI